MRGSEHEDEDFDWKKHATKKTPEEKDGIAEAIKASIMFRNINDEQREMIYSCMESVKVKAGSWVIRQGTVGDRFYIIDEGRFQVRIVPDGEDDVSGQGGHIVHVYEGSRARHAHPAFGELALMYSAPRSASIVAQTDGHLWALHRAAFRQVLIQAQDHRKELKTALGEIPYFQYLDSDGINKLAAIMDEITFGRGETIIQQGQRGDTMFVVASGACSTVHQSSSGKSKRVDIKAGKYFGDEIFNGKGKYAKTVVTLQTTTCWQLDANLLKQTMGPLLQGGS
jgi:cAMP-dependent protein kinase regulator